MQLENSNQGGDKKYVTILADGKFHQTVPAGTEGAVIRTYEDKSGVEQSKSELVFDSVTGIITKISFKDKEGLGNFIEVEIDNDGVLSIGTSSSFGEDIMKKLPSLDLTKEVKFVPYSFEDKGKSIKGVTVYQSGIKVESHYYDKVNKKSINGCPEPEGDEKSSDDWKMYFMKVRKFLIKEVSSLTL